jgi:pilus assembly protein CpaE
MPKRPEIKMIEFAKAIGTSPVVSIPFDPQMFGAAANNGQMIAEIAANHPTTEMFRRIAEVLTGQGAIKPIKQTSLLAPFMEKLWPKKPSLPENAADRRTATVRKISSHGADS